MSTELYTCPCCGYKTLPNGGNYGSYEICKVCFWEDDQLQYQDPKMTGGANPLSLVECQKNFIKFGACDEKMIPNVKKPDTEVKDPNWKPFEQ
eukprot:gene6050-7535_t